MRLKNVQRASLFLLTALLAVALSGMVEACGRTDLSEDEYAAIDSGFPDQSTGPETGSDATGDVFPVDAPFIDSPFFDAPGFEGSVDSPVGDAQQRRNLQDMPKRLWVVPSLWRRHVQRRGDLQQLPPGLRHLLDLRQRYVRFR